MAHILTPPASRESSETPDAELKQLHIADPATDPLLSLDILLERYLHLLDQHQKLQAELATKLSSGFLSLAQANYTCPPGRRYGADYYDERMKATRRMALQPPSSLGERDHTTEPEESLETDTKNIFSIVSVADGDEEEEKEEEQPGTEDHTELSRSTEEAAIEEPPSREEDRDSGKSTAKCEGSSNPPKAEPEAYVKPQSVKKKPQASDPIRWYGILVPPFLRSAQRSFTGAVEDCLPQLASVVVEMQAAEKEISRLRNELGRQ